MVIDFARAGDNSAFEELLKRKQSAIRNLMRRCCGADELSDLDAVKPHMFAARMDLDTALATLPDTVRLCVVISYHEGLSHSEIATLTSLPLGTVKSHIQRRAIRLQKLLAAYDKNTKGDRS